MAMELKTTGVNGFVKPAELTNMETLLNAVNDELLTGKGAGSDFLGWLDLPVNYDKEEFARIQKAAKKIQGDSDVLVVIGIGGPIDRMLPQKERLLTLMRDEIAHLKFD